MTSVLSPSRIDDATLAFVDALPYPLLARAEVNHDLHGEHAQVNLFAIDPDTFATICALRGGPDLAHRDAEMRRFFDLMPRHWVKVSPRDEATLSEYYQLRTPSLTAIRMFLHRHDAADANPWIGEVFAPLFEERPAYVWGLVVKWEGDIPHPRISVRLPSKRVARVLADLTSAGFLSADHARKLRDTFVAAKPGTDAYLSVDPGTPGAVAIDLPSPNRDVLASVTGTDLDWLGQGQISFAKLRLADGSPSWSLYRPAVEALPAHDRATHTQRVRRYYDELTPVIAETFGATYQAGLYEPASEQYEAKPSTLALARRAGIEDAAIEILDLGCGLAGPAIDIAEAYPNVRITGVNLSETQVERARGNVAQAGLADRIEVVHADFHALPFAEHQFDVVVAFEALGYAYDLNEVAREAFRVLKPGGTLYAKELVKEEAELNSTAAENLSAHDRTYAMRTPTLAEHCDALECSGFDAVQAHSIDEAVSTEPYQLAMFDLPDGNTPSLFAGRNPTLTAFGRTHFNDHGELPLFFAELLARKPVATDDAVATGARLHGNRSAS